MFYVHCLIWIFVIMLDKEMMFREVTSLKFMFSSDIPQCCSRTQWSLSKCQYRSPKYHMKYNSFAIRLGFECVLCLLANIDGCLVLPSLGFSS